MNAKLAEEHGKVVMEKVIKDGRNGWIVPFSSLVEKQLLADDKRLMVAKAIRVAKRFLSGAVDPADSRWCNAKLDASTITPANKGIEPGGSVKLPTQAQAPKGMLTITFARPGAGSLRQILEARRERRSVPACLASDRNVRSVCHLDSAMGHGTRPR
jgi:hypothetical protein